MTDRTDNPDTSTPRLALVSDANCPSWCDREHTPVAEHRHLIDGIPLHGLPDRPGSNLEIFVSLWDADGETDEPPYVQIHGLDSHREFGYGCLTAQEARRLARWLLEAAEDAGMIEYARSARPAVSGG